MKKVVFICHGNMFRSQVATAFFNNLMQGDFRAKGYGTHVTDRGLQDLKLVHRPGLEILIAELKKYNIDISNEKCDQLKEEYLKEAERVVMMAEKEFIPEWLGKYKYEYWEIANPEVHVEKEIGEIVSTIREKVLELIKKLR